MARPRILPDNASLLRMREGGMSYLAIANRYGVTCSAVSQALRKAGATRPRARHNIPWTVAREHDQERPVRMLRLYAQRERGDAITAKKNRLLDNWLREIDGKVVCYNRTEGFTYQPRQPEDGDSLTRG